MYVHVLYNIYVYKRYVRVYMYCIINGAPQHMSYIHLLCVCDCSCTWSAMYIPIACRYLKEISKLRLTETRICKATKHRIFSVAVHPTTSQLLVAAGDKWGGVGLWNLVSACRVYYSKKAFIVLLCDDCGNVPGCQGSSRNWSILLFHILHSSAMQCLCMLMCG